MIMWETIKSWFVLPESTGTEIINTVIGKFEETQSKLENGIRLVEIDVALNEGKIARLEVDNQNLNLTKRKANKVVDGLKILLE